MKLHQTYYHAYGGLGRLSTSGPLGASAPRRLPAWFVLPIGYPSEAQMSLLSIIYEMFPNTPICIFCKGPIGYGHTPSGCKRDKEAMQ